MNDEGDFVGFDVVIGNPPYIQIQTLSESEKKVFTIQLYKTFDKSADLYCLFYELGFNILSHKGNLNLITSNKFIRSKYGLNTRLFLEERQIVEMIDFVELPLFENAATFPFNFVD
ncbi:MAG: Eco57I restriction-modification methylase domain-containing protein [Saprospiraceae bacterium]|nr:Eco57I restriction-modification methylase domain-containing protein [Saprospiraceae bacterium]